MAVYVAPGVYGRDVDLSQIVRNQATAVGALVGQSERGPSNKRILFTNIKDVVELLGKPNPVYGYGVHCLLCALEEMSRCYFFRCVKNGLCAGLLVNVTGVIPDTFPVAEGVPDVSEDTMEQVFPAAKLQLLGTGNGTVDTFTGTLSPFPLIDVMQINLGTVANPVTVNNGVIQGSGILAGTINLVTGAISVQFTSPPQNNTDVNVLFKYSDTVNTAFMIFAENPGEWANNVKVQIAANSWDSELFRLRVYETVDGVDLFRELFDVSRKRKTDQRGVQLYLEDRINGRSQYIRVMDNNAVPDDVMPNFTDAAINLSGGAEGESIDEGEIVQGWQQFANPSVVDMNILINGGYVSLDTWAVHSSLQALAEMRRDCFAILDIPYDATRMYPLTEARIWRIESQNINSNFTALYSPWVLVYDTYNDVRAMPIPPSGFVAQVYARTDSVREPWYAPAGYNRGVLVSQVLPPMDLTERYGVPGVPGQIGELEALYEAPSSINPIIFSPGDGIVVFGQKTQQTKPSALDRVNVRRLIITTERAMKQFLKYKLFELNNKFTRRDITAALTQYMNDIQARNGVYTFKVVCDESNNTPQVIDNNELHVDVYMQPQRAAEFIQLQSIITRTGVDFRVLILTGGNF